MITSKLFNFSNCQLYNNRLVKRKICVKLLVNKRRKGKEMKKIAVLCSGGDCQAMNACIKAIADTCHSNGIELLGVNRGYQGLIENDQ